MDYIENAGFVAGPTSQNAFEDGRVTYQKVSLRVCIDEADGDIVLDAVTDDGVQTRIDIADPRIKAELRKLLGDTK